MVEGPVYRVPLSIFVFANPYLIFGERGKTVWDTFTDSEFAEYLLHRTVSLFYISFRFRPRIKVSVLVVWAMEAKLILLRMF